MKKEYQKPIAVCTDLDNGKTFSNSSECERELRRKNWLRDLKKERNKYLVDESAEAKETHGEKENVMEGKDSFRANPEFIYREIAGESVLVPVGKAAESFFGIASVNAAGAFLWKALEKECSLQELIELFAKEYELELEQSMQDVTEFIEMALSRNMVLRC